MANTLKLPVGIDDFRKLRESHFYYVDKTRLIEQLLLNWSEVTLFTRPRRFGKTLNMSMLKSFFDIGTDKALFDGLDENTYFRRILDIRRKDVSDLQGKELTSAIEAQNYYELDENKTVEAQEAKVASFADSLKALAQS